jgi:Ankyrin repeats (3 copies)/SLBB domain
MKTRSIALVMFAIAMTGFAGLGQETNQPARPIPIDPHAMQMQMAILKDRDIYKVEELLKQGVDINAPIGCGTYAPLDGAVSTENMEMLKFLLAHGAKPRGREMVEAAFIDNPKIALNFVKMLLSTGVDPNATNNNGGTAISNAAYRGNHDLVVLLLAQPHINVDMPDGSGDTALMGAADHGSVDIENLLLKAGANPHLKDSWGQKATDMDERVLAKKKAVEPYVYVSGGVVKPGCYHWIQGMTALDAIHVAGGFTNFVSGPILITHTDSTCEIWDYPPATIDPTNHPPVLSRNVDVYARIF